MYLQIVSLIDGLCCSSGQIFDSCVFHILRMTRPQSIDFVVYLVEISGIEPLTS